MATKKTTAKKASVKKAAPAKTSTKKAATKKTAAKKTSSKYGPAASKQVERDMREMKEGKLTSGRSGRKVSDPKQAIAIALSEARKKGAKVPPNPNR